MVISTVQELALAITESGGDGAKWWLKRHDQSSCVMGLLLSPGDGGTELVFVRELWSLAPPDAHLHKVGDWSGVDYDKATNVLVHCQKDKVTFQLI